eukprot:scaffold1040_cov54-Phaeocystis_antarctica.AAC.1
MSPPCVHFCHLTLVRKLRDLHAALIRPAARAPNSAAAPSRDSLRCYDDTPLAGYALLPALPRLLQR